MANNGQNIVGEIERHPFETVGRSETWAEQREANVTIVGKFDDLVDKVKPGDSMGKFSSWFKGKFNSSWFVRTVDLVSPDGVTGDLKLSLRLCSQGKTKPYNVTWDVSMEEVQMKLINHPDIIKNCNIENLLKWEDTEAGMRVEQDKKDKTKLKFKYQTWDGNRFVETPITAPWEVAYCNAVTLGPSTYNKYLPVITKNSYYLELPGVRYDSNTHVVTGGTISEFTGADAIGHFDDPELKVAGYTSRDGVWFKSCDKFTSQPDGTWVRTETWTFSDDKRHTWIYTGELPQ